MTLLRPPSDSGEWLEVSTPQSLLKCYQNWEFASFEPLTLAVEPLYIVQMYESALSHRAEGSNIGRRVGRKEGLVFIHVYGTVLGCKLATGSDPINVVHSVHRIFNLPIVINVY
jgi:hypothetical protein